MNSDAVTPNMRNPTNTPQPIALARTLEPPPNCLANRVVLVTGATGTLGRVAALAFAEHGATVVLHGKNERKLELVYDEIVSLGGPTPAMLTLDFEAATEAQFRGIAETVSSTFKQLDGIFHAATHIAPLMPLAMQDSDCWRAHWAVNTLGPVALTRACLPILKRAPRAAVVFLSASPALNPKAYWGAFAVSKAALLDVSSIWNDELERDTALRFFTYVPGPVATHARSVTHPGELASELRPPADLARDFVLMVSLDPRLPAGQLLGPAA